MPMIENVLKTNCLKCHSPRDFPAEVLLHHHFFHHLQSLAPEAHAVHLTQWLPYGDLPGGCGIFAAVVDAKDVGWRLESDKPFPGKHEFFGLAE
eukprot:symbB.v1.2.027763.t1/scaffold2862.1/size68630/3